MMPVSDPVWRLRPPNAEWLAAYEPTSHMQSARRTGFLIGHLNVEPAPEMCL